MTNLIMRVERRNDINKLKGLILSAMCAAKLNVHLRHYAQKFFLGYLIE